MKQTFDIPAGCNKVTIEKINNTIVTTFEPEFKQGDVVVVNTDYIVMLDRIDAETGNVCSFCYHNKINGFTYIDPSTHVLIGYNIRHATDEERQLLVEAFKLIDYQWNPEKLELEKIKWVPKLNEKYYYIWGAEIIDTAWLNWDCDKKRHKSGLIFKTLEEGNTFLEEVKQLAKNRK